ncbi:class I SAM-dependent methyltransferase [Mesorhizobium sp.]|uniref:class I SAM-dependent methyltransferase n=1 Tax=Mesorhizobium sp. TaxID=1871066 RepID=UPI000FE776DB|nr:class I SAM-dependent methyltransferase [Mesorhizobium sp.]RWI20599.1 MAG: class I SAM-dependent methyltransferase [Mesorhizobium sp.]RWK45059.1 MAG: class I SAM-dependent methyltransferase [Mesorhizobium sp.]RWK88103.1 MAG: class I SAM-dependent methyltransferase [Mesorhizobium sp.]RWL00670.1 MAG: class I SAM-dependent methyltransferase [Mesorhizobium sp.]TIP56493.1 MAG: class I SAM-dependent methyltransferase [Mesorhizobium sp.]
MADAGSIIAIYDDYYADGKVAAKREIASQQSVGHIEAILPGETFEKVLDIGAGEGAVLDKLNERNLAKTLGAVEISTSGIEAIKARKIPSLKSLDVFDGYHIPHPDKSFDLGLAIHVVEHVEHERMFLMEAARVCKKLYIEVPLEHTRNLNRAIRMSGPFGHINFYTPLTFENLLNTSGLKVDRLMTFAHDLAYEQHLAGRSKGWVKYKLRTEFLKVAPKTAVRNMTYMAGALCSTK